MFEKVRKLRLLSRRRQKIFQGGWQREKIPKISKNTENSTI